MSWSQGSNPVTTGDVNAAILAIAALKASNLSDLTDPAAARTNLGLDALVGFVQGHVLRVDSVYGDDLIASPSGPPYATIEAAVGDSVDGDVIWVFPGEYSLAAGITLPAGVALRGLSHKNVLIQKLLATTDFTLVTMSNRNCVENISFLLTSAEHHTLKGIVFPGTSTNDCEIEGCSVTVNNSTASDVGTSNVYGVHGTGTGLPVEAFNNVTNSTIDVDSAGLGAKRGVLVDTAAGFLSVDTAYIDCARTGVGAGSYIGEEVNFAGASLMNRLGTVSGYTADISQTLGTLTLGTPQLVNATANGLGFETITQIPSFGWGDNGAAQTGTRYMYIGTATPSTNEAGIAFGSKACMLNMSVRARVGPGGVKTDTWVLRKNGVDTGLTVSLTGASLTAITTNVSVTFQVGDVVSVKQVISAGSTTDDVQIRCSYV